MQLTVDKLQNLATDKDNQALALKYIQLKEYAKVTKEKIDAIEKPIFESMEFWTDPGNTDEPSERIDWINDLYLTDNDSFAIWVDKCHEAYINAGYDVKHGFSPALIAEHDVIKCSHKIIDVMCKLMGVGVPASMRHRDEMIRLFTEMCMHEIKKQSRHN